MTLKFNDRYENFFNYILNQYKVKSAQAQAAGQVDPGVPILTDSSLRLEQFINANTTLYNFPVMQGEVAQGSTQVLPNEIRLQQNDNFHIREIGIYIARTVASTDTNFRLMSYPNEVELTAAAFADYFNVYNGNLKINVNQVDVLTQWRVSKHMMVPQTQRLSLAAAANRDQIDLSMDGMINCNPSIMLSGAYTNVVTIQLNAAVTTALAANNSRIVMIYDGLRAQNAAIRK